MALSADSILKHAGSLGRKEVHVPSWADEHGDDTVIVRAVTIREWEIHQDRLRRIGDDEKRQGKANAQLVARCVVDENGRRVFTDAQVDTIAELGAGDVSKVAAAIVKVSGLDDDEQTEAEVRGESDAAQTSDSSPE